MQKGRVANWNICMEPVLAAKPHYNAQVCVIGTNSAMYFARSMAECARMLRNEKDMSSISYAGELPENWRTYFNAIVLHMHMNSS